MINVQMTRSLKEREPKLFGFVTKKQALGLIIAFIIMCLCLTLIKLPFTTRLVISIVPVLPVLIIFFYPENEGSPLNVLRYYISEFFSGKDRKKTRDNNTFYYRKPGEEKTRIRRHPDYPGIR